MKRTAAFTLIEVLIALLIIAIALAAAIRATNQSVQATIHTRNTVVAHWVGLNILSEIQTGIMKAPDAGNSASGKINMLDRDWEWTVHTGSSIQETGIMPIRVDVALNHHKINSVTGYV